MSHEILSAHAAFQNSRIEVKIEDYKDILKKDIIFKINTLISPHNFPLQFFFRECKVCELWPNWFLITSFAFCYYVSNFGFGTLACNGNLLLFFDSHKQKNWVCLRKWARYHFSDFNSFPLSSSFHFRNWFSTFSFWIPTQKHARMTKPSTQELHDKEITSEMGWAFL